MPVAVIRLASARKLSGYGQACYYCNKIIFDLEYVARTKTSNTVYYHSICALKVNLVDNLSLSDSGTPFKHLDRSQRLISRAYRKKRIMFGRG
jgi:hypothetical protein